MEKGSGNSGSPASKLTENFGYIGTIIALPEKTTTVGEGSFENKTRVTFGDKQGCYGRATATAKASAGEFEWKNGKSGTRSEYKETSTVRIGHKNGYTEVYKEQRVRDVIFNNNNGSKNVIAYDNCKGGGGNYGGYEYAYGCYGYDSDSD